MQHTTTGAVKVMNDGYTAYLDGETTEITDLCRPAEVLVKETP